VKRVVILGRGAAGKSVTAARLGQITGLPVIELDRHFWKPGPNATPPAEWARTQRELLQREAWIMDGDLGPYDTALGARLAAADTVIVLDFPLVRCAWRALRRSRERADFWRWLLGYRRRNLPLILRAIADHAPAADVEVLSSPRAVRRFLIRAADHGKLGS
jgi:adenylate kinase family enzyme